MNLQPLARVTRGIVLAMLSLVAVAVFPTTFAPEIAASPTDSAVVRAGSDSIPPGETSVTLPVEVSNVQNLGAATVIVSYDPAALAVNDCRRGSAFNFGLCNTEYAPDAVRFNVNAVSGVTTTAETPVTLVELTWELTDSEPGVTSTVEVTILTFTDVDSVPIAVAPEDGQISVIAQKVTIDAIMMVAANLGQPAAGTLAAYDPVADGTIDQQDLAAFAEAWRDVWP